MAKTVIGDLGEDFIYNKTGEKTCVYFVGTSPSCVIGHMLCEEGVTRNALIEDPIAEGHLLYPELRNEATVDDLIRDGIVAVEDYKTRVFLSELQSQQDGGSSWGDAYERAVENSDLEG